MHVSAILRGATLGCAALAGVLTTGCGAAGQSPRAARDVTPASPVEARGELARLEQKIEGARKALGLSPRAKEIAGGEVTRAKSDPGLTFEPEPAPQSAARPEAASETDGEPRSACSDNCRLSRAICHAARRICSIAGYLGDEDAAGRCKRARQDCREARKAKPEDCSGCR